MQKYIAGMKFSALFLLACGAVVREREALAGLEAAVKEYGFLTLVFLHANPFRSLQFTDAFAFGAERLISHYPAMWMISYADQVISGGQPSKDSIASLLYSSGVGKHTSLVYINRSASASGEVTINTSRYIWEHKSQRPHTFSFPIACPLCAHIYPWQSIPSHLANAPAEFTINCKTKLGDGQRCKGTWVVPACPESSIVNALYVGTWRVM